ncbi:pre-peptidase C-terminal domain-containing protein [Singulisphaera sp. GP187]|nr:pre-peptidase C-terminal domain-containing protein [Singulisphaera sp. GP187]
MTTRPIVASLIALLATASAAKAKPPTLDRLFPPGAQRGQTVAVKATGSFDHWPVHVWSDGPAIEVKAEKEKGQLSIIVASDAKPGVHWIRLSDEEGATSLRPFLVGVLPELVESESKDQPNIALDHSRVTINGRLGKSNDVDEFSVPMKKGQLLVAAVDANRLLGSPMDAVLQVASTDGFVLAQNDDDRGFDPRLTFEVPADGTYLVRIFAFPATPDSTIGFAGGDAYIYRLTLTTGGFLDHGYPLAVARSDPGQVEAHGWNVPETAKRLAVVADGNHETASLIHPDFANTVDIRLVAHAALIEQEPSDRDHPQAIPVPSTVSGRIAPARDQDVFTFPAKKGQTLSLLVESESLGAPLDPVLRVTDAAGKTLNDVDDSGKEHDVQLAFTPPADGDYQLSIRDLHGHGGERFVYRLTIAAPDPDYTLTLKADRLTLTPDKAGTLEVAIERKNGFKSPIEVRFDGLPEGMTAPSVRSEPGKDTEKTVTLSLTATAMAAATAPSGPFRVLGRAVDGAMVERPARFAIEGLSATTDQPWLTVLKPAAPKAP